jgi:hypothetical protein
MVVFTHADFSRLTDLGLPSGPAHRYTSQVVATAINLILFRHFSPLREDGALISGQLSALWPLTSDDSQMPSSLRTLIRRKTQASGQEKWHQQIENFRELSEYLSEGRLPPDPAWIEALKRSTAVLVNTTVTQEARDDALRELIRKHVTRSKATRDIAVLSCLPAFSPPGALESILALSDLPEVRYLRVLGLASHLTTTLLAEDELLVLHTLLAILYGQQEALVGLRRLIEALVARSKATFITNDIVGKILEESGIRNGIESAVLDLLDTRRFATLYEASSWLRIIDTAKNRTELEVFLNDFFPSWSLLWFWRPNVERIRQFESADLNQRRKLGKIYDLDGPDTMGRRHECLARFQPAASQRLDLLPQNEETLDRLLDDLHQTHRIGGAAVDFFVYVFVDQHSDGDTVELFHACIQARNNSLCLALHSFLKQSEASKRNTSLGGCVESIANAITSFSSAAQTEEVLPRYIATNAIHMLQRAQNRFCERLERGLSTEYVGTCIHELGSAMSQAAWIRRYIPPEIHQKLLLLPSSQVLESIFQLLHDMPGSEATRFKSYLESSLGGRAEVGGGRVTLDEIQEEVNFWKRSPDVARRDLARNLVRMQILEYAEYTKCLTAMIGEVDFYIEEMRHLLQLGGLEAVREFTRYLRKRHYRGQLKNECWLELLFTMIRGHGDQWLKGVAETMDFQHWQAFILDYKFIIQSTQPEFPGARVGFTQNELRWWDYLSEKRDVVELILRHPLGERSFLWIYFPDNHTVVDQLITALSDDSGKTPMC